MDELCHTHIMFIHSETSEMSSVTQLGCYNLIALVQVLLIGLNS